jgi:ethanolamine utilization protein EutQ (cupin superfamily)
MSMDCVLVKKADIITEYLDCGEGNNLKIMDVIAQPQKAPFTFGVVELEKSVGVDFDYDNDGACCYMLEGVITLKENLSGAVMKYEAGDIVYIPQKEGLVVTWSAEDYAKFAFVTYPHWR